MSFSMEVKEELSRVVRENSIENITKQLDRLPVYETFYPILVEQGKINQIRTVYTYLENNKASILCAVQDVTEAYEHEASQKEQLRIAMLDAKMANKAKTEFLSTMSHDMRTPMNGILGLTYLMDEQNDINIVKKYTVQLRDAAQYLLQLINAVLDVNKIESGKLFLHPYPCDEEKLFDSIVAMVKPLLDAKNIDFHFTKIRIHWQYMILDEQRVKQIFINLLSNAIKFTPEGGRIDFTMELVSQTNNMIVDKFVIKDTGIGISPQFLPHIFEAFTQDALVNGGELVGFGVHEVVQIAVGIAVFHVLAVYKCIFKLFGGVKGCFSHAAGDDVSHFGAHKGGTLAGLYVLKFDYLHYLAIHLKGNAISEFACCYHNRSSCIWI